MRVNEIVIDYLRKNGYDGLCGDGCGCGLDDFAPCDEDFGNCEPAYKVRCHKEKCENKNECDGDDNIGCFKPIKVEGSEEMLEKLTLTNTTKAKIKPCENDNCDNFSEDYEYNCCYFIDCNGRV